MDGLHELADYGVKLTFPEGSSWRGPPIPAGCCPAPSIVDVLDALESPLALYDVEFVHIVGPSDSVDWMAAQAKADELWNQQRPTYFKLEARLPFDGEDLNAYVAAPAGGAAGGGRPVRDRLLPVWRDRGYGGSIPPAQCRWPAVRTCDGIPVQRATGRVKDGPISQLTLPDGWEAVQPTLESNGFQVAKKYAGLEGAYWGDSRTLAEDTSDFRYEEVLRTVFKAVRLTRIAALKSMYDEAGDPCVRIVKVVSPI